MARFPIPSGVPRGRLLMPSVPDDNVLRQGKPIPRVVGSYEELGVQSTLVAFDVAVVTKTP